MQDQLKKDEKSWANERADIPYEPSMDSSHHSKSSFWNEFGKTPEHLANMSDFSGLSRYGNAGPTDFSIGRYFSGRSQGNLDDFLPAKSPKKNLQKPMSLIPPNNAQSHTG